MPVWPNDPHYAVKPWTRRYWRHRRVVTIVLATLLGVALALGVLVLLIKVLPTALASTGNLKGGTKSAEIDRTRTAVLAAAAGLVAATGAALTLLSYLLTRSAQFTERFSRAVSQMGDAQPELAVGGIFALERIAKDSLRDYPAVIDLLTEYVRINARWVKGEDWRDDPCGDGAPQGIDVDDPNIRDLPEFERPADRAGVQAAMTVVGRRDHRNDTAQLDLRSADLRRLDLHAANLAEAKLSRTNLARAWLAQADLRAAGLSDTCLDDCALSDAVLARARLERARLRRAFLEAADLSEAVLEHAHLEGANLKRARLRRAKLAGAYLDGADVRGADFKEADFRPASTSGLVYDDHTKWPGGYKPPEPSSPPPGQSAVTDA